MVTFPPNPFGAKVAATKWSEDDLLKQITSGSQTETKREDQDDPMRNDRSTFDSRLTPAARLLLPARGETSTQTPEEMDQDALTAQLAEAFDLDTRSSSDTRLSHRDREVLREWLLESQKREDEWHGRGGGYF